MEEFNLSSIKFLDNLNRGTTEQQIGALKEIVIDLMMEIEALRSAMIEEAKSKGIDPKDSFYGKAYRDTGLLTHCAVGPSSGRDKLLTRFISVKTTANGIQLREALMLLKLGYSPDEIAGYANDAEHGEMLT